MDRRSFISTMIVGGGSMLLAGGAKALDEKPGAKPASQERARNPKALDFEVVFDVVVAGAGVAGVAAALAATRCGYKTCLLEKTVYPGGLATSGCVNVYLPLSDNRGNQVTFGISEELLLASIKYGPGDIPPDWMKGPKPKHRYGSKFAPMSFILALDELLREAGVEFCLDTLVCGARVEAGRLKGVEVENKSGRGLITGKVFVDASGDADVAHRAGAPCATALNALTLWGLAYDLAAARKAVKEGSGDPLMKSFAIGASDDGSGHPRGMRRFSGVDGQDVSEFILTGRQLTLDYYKRMQAECGPNGRKDFFPAFLPAMADFRTTRRIEGLYTLNSGGQFTHFPDCVGVAADWRGGHDLWEVPYRSLVAQRVRGLLAAGRCMGAAGQAWSVMRVIQAAAMTGEVCGLAAAMSVERACTPDKLDIAALQGELKKRKFLLDLREINSGMDVKEAPGIADDRAGFYG